jgi:shikimate dehydrogenase
MQNAALRAVGLESWRYQLVPVPPELFAETIRAMPGAGFRGVNVTVPHKEAALAVADEGSERARAIGAANTLLFGDGGEIYAENTDAPALIGALPFPAPGKTALVLGAGGSARAAVWALLAEGASEVRVWNRTPDRARALADGLGAIAVDGATAADLLVNCTPLGLGAQQGYFKQLPIEADDITMFGCVVDLVYSHADTPLVRAARTLGVAVVDGLELLVGQGALSFEQFTGRPAPIEVMRGAVQLR